MAGATVELFVAADSMIEAITRATDYVMSRAWFVTLELSAAAVTDDMLEVLDESSSAQLRQAEKSGMHALFVGYPRQDREGDVIQMYPLRDKDMSDPSEH